MTTASIIVCTRNRADMLAGCLASILADPSAADREIIVVDNGSTDHTKSVIDTAAAGAPLPVTHVHEPRMGQSVARNTGIRAARSELLLFTDDDVLVQPGWADALVAGFADQRVGGVAGRIVPEWLEPPPEWMDGAHAVLITLPDRGTRSRLLEPHEDPTGANMAIRASAIAGVDQPFNPGFGHRGTVSMGFEEVALFNRIRQDHRLWYEPSALVRHRVTPGRMSWEAMRRGHFQAGFGRARAARSRPGGHEPETPTRRAARAGRAVARSALARADTRRQGRNARSAEREFAAYSALGHDLDMLLSRTPRLADWTARVLVADRKSR